MNLINLFTNDILVAEFPATIQLAFLFNLLPDMEGDLDAGIEILLDGKIALEMQAVIHKARVKLLTSLPTPQFIIEVKGASELSARVKIGDYANTNVLRKNIRKDETLF